ncbi:MAG: hypothetical protein ABJB12_12905 [Pseudomonadota bacterium]
MSTERRGVPRRALLGVACAAMIPTLSACAPAAGGAVVAGVVAIAALTSHCYDYLDLTVFDAQGRKTCAATVTASAGRDHFKLGSCYYAPLTDGVWTLRATLAGYVDATTTVPVEHAHDCARHVQTVELTLSPVRPLSAPTAPLEKPPTSTPIAPGPQLSPAPAPSLSASGVAPTPSQSAAPSASGTPPLGVFPQAP